MNECTHSTIEVETRVFFSATPYPLRSFLSHFFFTSFLQPSGEEQSSGLWILGPTRRGLSLHKRKLLNCVIKKVSQFFLAVVILTSIMKIGLGRKQQGMDYSHVQCSKVKWGGCERKQFVNPLMNGQGFFCNKLFHIQLGTSHMVVI